MGGDLGFMLSSCHYLSDTEPKIITTSSLLFPSRVLITEMDFAVFFYTYHDKRKNIVFPMFVLLILHISFLESTFFLCVREKTGHFFYVIPNYIECYDTD